MAKQDPAFKEMHSLAQGLGAMCPDSEQDAILASNKREREPKKTAVDGKVYFSYAEVHDVISSLVPRIQAEFQPDIMVAIGGGGFIPARMLRTELKIPILAVSLELYDDATKSMNTEVKIKQWFDESTGLGQMVRGKKVLIVDEVDDTRTTLQYCVQELQKRNGPAQVAVAVVHNKLKPKKGALPETVRYYAGEEVPNQWNCYPWDAMAYGNSIHEHERIARGSMKSSVADEDCRMEKVAKTVHGGSRG